MTLVGISRTVLNNSSDRCTCHFPDINENAFMDLIINTMVAFGWREIFFFLIMLRKYPMIL